MHLGQIDLNLLVALDALLTERNVSRAGERIDLSQPAMSSALRRLRGIFGDELLVRVGREYHLTPLAEGLVDPVREILRLVEQTVEYRPAFDPVSDRRVFRIASSDTLEYMLIQPLLQRLAHTAPGVAIEVQSLAGRLTIDMIEAGELDMGLWPVGFFECNLVQDPLYEERVVYAAWAGAEIPEYAAADQLAPLPRSSYTWSWYDRAGLTQSALCLVDEDQMRFADEHTFLRLFMLRGTDMIMPAPEGLVRRLADVADVRVVEPPREAARIVEGMLWHPRNTGDPAHGWLRAQFTELAGGVQATLAGPPEPVAAR